jgi:hypothetical protein
VSPVYHDSGGIGGRRHLWGGRHRRRGQQMAHPAALGGQPFGERESISGAISQAAKPPASPPPRSALRDALVISPSIDLA